jgi:hypothetical protein
MQPLGANAAIARFGATHSRSLVVLWDSLRSHDTVSIEGFDCPFILAATLGDR